MPDTRKFQPITPTQYSGVGSEQLVQTRSFVPNIQHLNRYDIGLRDGVNQSYVRGENQSWINQAANANFRFGISTLAKMGDGFAGVASLLGEVAKSPFSDKPFNWSSAFENGVSDAFKALEAKTEQFLPIYGSQKYSEGNLAQKIWTSSFWTQDVADGIEFLASAYVPGTQLSKVGSLTKGLSKIDKFKGLATALNEGKNFSKLGAVDNLTGLAVNTLYATTSEAMVEGKGVYDDVKNQLREQNPDLSEREIEQKAGKAASKTFKYNMAYLLIPNLLESKWLFGKTAVKEVRSIAKLASETPEKLRYALPKAFATGLASEGLWEENMQSAVQNYETRLAVGTKQDKQNHLDYALEGVKGFAKALLDIPFGGRLGISAAAGSDEDMAATAILLGGLIGGPMATFSGYKDVKAKNQEIAEAQGQAKTADKFLRYAMNQFVDSATSPYKTFGNNADGTPNYINPITKETELDKESLKKLFFNHLQSKDIEAEAFAAGVKGDPVHLETTVQKALAQSAWQIADYAAISKFSQEDIEYLVDQRVKNSESDTAAESQLAGEGVKQVKLEDTLATRKQELLSYIKIAQEVQEEIYSSKDFSEDPLQQQFNKDIHRAGFYAKSLEKSYTKLLTMPNMSEENTQFLMDEIESNKKVWEGIKKDRAKLFETYKEQVAPLFILQEEESKVVKDLIKETDPTEKAKLQTKLASLAFEISKLQAVEGTEKIYNNAEVNSTLNDIYTARMFGSRQTLSKISSIPLKDLGYYATGNTALLQSELPEDVLKDILNFTALINTYLSNNKAIGNIPELDTIYNILETKRKEVAVKAESLKRQLENTSDPAVQTEYDAILEQLGEIQSALDTKTKYDNASGIYSELIEATKTNNVAYFTKQHINKYLAGVNSLVDRYLALNDENDIDDSVGVVQAEIVKLKTILSIINDPTSRTSQELGEENRIIEGKDLEDKLQILEHILNIVANKSNKRAKVQIQIEDSKANALVSLLRSPKILNILKAVDPTIDSKIDTWLNSSHPYMYISTYIYKMMENEAVQDVLKKEFEDMQVALSNVNIRLISDKQADIDNYIANPNYTLNIPFSKFFPREFTSEAYGLFKQFIKNLDIFWFKNELDKAKYNMFDEVDRERYSKTMDTFMNNHVLINELIHFSNFGDANLGITNVVEAETEVNAKEKSPTFQQFSIIRKALVWFKAPWKKTNKAVDLQNVIAIRGIIGTGKTQIVLKQIVKLLTSLKLVKLEEVVLVGHSDNTTRQLNLSIKGKEAEHSLEDIIAEPTLLENKKFLLVDEAAAMSNANLIALINAANTYKVKVLLAGDMSQNKTETFPIFAFNKDLNFLEALSVVYRTNIAAITNAAIAFRDMLHTIVDADFVSNLATPQDVKTNPNTALGAMAMSEADVLDIFKTPSTRSRAIIVTNSAEVVRIQAKLPDSEKGNVYDFISIQGKEVEEAYIILNKRLAHPNNVAFTDLVYNTAMYTSIGRATKFAGIVVPNIVANNIESSSLQEDADTAKKDFDIISNEYTSILNIARGELGLKTKAPVKVKEEEVSNVKKEGETEEEEDSHLPEDPSQEDTDDPKDGTAPKVPEKKVDLKVGHTEHLLQFPTNKHLKNPEVNTSKVYIVKSEDGKYYVLAKAVDYDKTSTVYPVAVLGEEELDETNSLSSYLKNNKLLTSKGVRMPKATLKGPFALPNIDSLALGEFSTSTVAPLQMSYTETREEATPLNLKNTIKTFFDSLFYKAKGKYNLEASNAIKSIFKGGDINWTNLSNHASVRIYTKAEIEPLRETHDFLPTAGVPYLVFNNITWESKNRSNNPHQPLYIRLHPKKYNPKTITKLPYIKDYVQQIEDFWKAFRNLKGLIELTGIDSALNVKEKGADGKMKESAINRLIDSYARYMYEPKQVTLNMKTSLVLQKKEGVTTDAWKESAKSIIDVTNIESSTLAANLDIIVQLTYGIRTGRKIVTLQEWLDARKTGESVGKFEPTRVKKHKLVLDKYLKEHPKATLEEAFKALEKQIPLDSNGYIYKSDAHGNQSQEEDYKITRNKGKLQNALNAIASANKSLGIAIQKERKGREDDEKGSATYTSSKNVWGTSSKGKAYYGQVRTLLTDALTVMQDAIKEAIDEEGGLPISYGGGLISGEEYRDKVRIDISNPAKLKFLDNSTPTAILFIAQGIVDYVEEAIETNSHNAFASHFSSIQDARNWYMDLEQQTRDIENSFQTDPLKEEDLENILEKDDEGTYNNVYVPFFTKSKTMQGNKTVDGYEGMGMDELGDLSVKANRDALEESLETNFTGVESTKLGIQIPTTASTKSAVKPKPKKVDPPSAPVKKKASVAKPLTQREQVIAILQDKANWGTRITMEDLLTTITMPKKLEKLFELLKTNPKFMSTVVMEIPKWQGLGIGSIFYGMEEQEGNNVIAVSSMQDFRKHPDAVLHEAIHNVTLHVFNKPEEELTKAEREFKEEITAIRAEVGRRNLDEQVFTESITARIEKEFIANLSNPDFYTVLSKERIDKGDLPSAVKAIWERVWKAVINLFSSGKEIDTIDLYSATYASFETYMNSRFKQEAKLEEAPRVGETVGTIDFVGEHPLDIIFVKSKVSSKMKEKLKKDYDKATSEDIKNLVIQKAKDQVIKSGEFSIATDMVDSLVQENYIEKTC